MIRGRCFSNDDDLRALKWPEVFPALPRVGDKVESILGRRAYVTSVIFLPEKNPGTISMAEIAIELTPRNPGRRN